ncbi:MAG: hypothetical protein J3Q66DRAFT_400814 [Benniella sp.]|nr:MAG: hypothetical protein J3Q66DRAFT_400814 [Benniella sp.]
MHQAILTIAILLLIAQTVLAQLLENGDYRIFIGSATDTENNHYFTAYPSVGNGYVLTYHIEDFDLQIWRLRNRGNDLVTLECKGVPGKYLGLRRSDVRPGAYVGLVKQPVRYRMTKTNGGGNRYELAYPRKVDNNTLVVTLDIAKSGELPYFAVFNIQNSEGVYGAFKFSRVS